MIDMFKPYVPNEAVEAVSNVLRTRWIGEGPKVKEFERAFRRKFNQKYIASLNSGTAALDMAYELIGLQPGDEVISTPLTCTATNLELLRKGVKIVWADINESSLCIDPDDVIRKITPKTKAIVQVHLGGIKADVGTHIIDKRAALSGDFAPEHIPVVSDAAQALGIFVGDYTICSFQAIKHLTTGDGGMIVCSNAKDAKKARLIRWFGIDREKKVNSGWQAYTRRKMTFNIELLGTKRQMNDIAAAMGIVGLQHYDEIINHAKFLFEIYRRRLNGIPGIKLIDGPENKCWLCTVLVENRDDLARVMYENDVDVNTVHVRNDIYKIFGGRRQDLPVMNKLEEQYLCLPIGMHVSEADVNFICDVIRKGW